jgi:hypothetical protein
MSAESPIVDLATQRAARRTDRRSALRDGQTSGRSAVVHAFPVPDHRAPEAGPGPRSVFGPVMAFNLGAGRTPADLPGPRVAIAGPGPRRAFPRGAGRSPAR